MSKNKKKIKRLKTQLKKQKKQHQFHLNELTKKLNHIETQMQSLKINLERLKSLSLDNNCNGKNNRYFND